MKNYYAPTYSLLIDYKLNLLFFYTFITIRYLHLHIITCTVYHLQNVKICTRILKLCFFHKYKQFLIMYLNPYIYHITYIYIYSIYSNYIISHQIIIEVFVLKELLILMDVDLLKVLFNFVTFIIVCKYINFIV